jgi:hypothetical protein
MFFGGNTYQYAQGEAMNYKDMTDEKLLKEMKRYDGTEHTIGVDMRREVFTRFKAKCDLLESDAPEGHKITNGQHVALRNIVEMKEMSVQLEREQFREVSASLRSELAKVREQKDSDRIGVKLIMENASLKRQLSDAQKEIERLTQAMKSYHDEHLRNVALMEDNVSLRSQLREADEAIIRCWIEPHSDGTKSCAYCGNSYYAEMITHEPTCIVLKSTERLKEK